MIKFPKPDPGPTLDETLAKLLTDFRAERAKELRELLPPETGELEDAT